MKKYIIAAALALGVIACDKEEAPQLEHCEKGTIRYLGVKQEHQINNNIWYYVWFNDECSGELISRRVDSKETWEALQVGDYYADRDWET